MIFCWSEMPNEICLFQNKTLEKFCGQKNWVDIISSARVLCKCCCCDEMLQMSLS
jgi:hypothetical protein